MRIKNGVVVHINFDGDIKWDDENTTVFSGKDSYIEAEVIVAKALLALSNYYSINKNNPFYIELEDAYGIEHNYDVHDVLSNKDLMYSFMCHGGIYVGNHSIEIIMF